MLLFPMMILARAEKSDNEFMKTVYIAHHVTMFRMARALTDSNQDAEDAVSDACMVIFTGLTEGQQLTLEGEKQVKRLDQIGKITC